MEKKKYEKPIVLDLNGNSATGGPLSCVDGHSANSNDETCITGTGAGFACGAGNTGDPENVALDCVYGDYPDGHCEGGAGGYNSASCRTGPQG